jgi:hypothetical protein
MTAENDIVQYYVNQAGSGIGSIYSGPLYQKGYGIGSFLGGLFRACIPFVKSRGVAVGKQLLKSGFEVIGDLQKNETLKDSLRKRKTDIYGKVADAIITGNGYLKRQKLNFNQSSFKNRPSKALNKNQANKTIINKAINKKKNFRKDIFGN